MLQSVTCQSDNLYYTYLQSKILQQSDGCLSSRSDTVIEISNLQQQRKQLTRLKTPWCQRGIKGSVWSQNNLVNKSIAFSSHCLLWREKKKTIIFLLSLELHMKGNSHIISYSTSLVFLVTQRTQGNFLHLNLPRHRRRRSSLCSHCWDHSPVPWRSAELSYLPSFAASPEADLVVSRSSSLHVSLSSRELKVTLILPAKLLEMSWSGTYSTRTGITVVDRVVIKHKTLSFPLSENSPSYKQAKWLTSPNPQKTTLI